MTDKAAITGDYCDLKFIKSRKVAVISVEIPIEAATAFVAAFGTPSPATGVPVALARLTEEPKAEKPKRSWSELSRAEQAGIACEDPKFRKYLADTSYGNLKSIDPQMAADAVRARCGVKSRSMLDGDSLAAKKWDELYSDYQRWKMGAAA